MRTTEQPHYPITPRNSIETGPLCVLGSTGTIQGHVLGHYRNKSKDNSKYTTRTTQGQHKDTSPFGGDAYREGIAAERGNQTVPVDPVTLRH